MEELKLCPHCGEKPQVTGAKEKFAMHRCSPADCIVMVPFDAWQQRPIEDALHAEITSIKLEMAQMASDRDSERRWADHYNKLAQSAREKLSMIIAMLQELSPQLAREEIEKLARKELSNHD